MYKENSPKTIYLKEYTAPDYFIEKVELDFTLKETATTVKSTMSISRKTDLALPLILDGKELILKNIAIDGRALSENEYKIEGEQLTILSVPELFQLEISTEINPKDNTALEGLYLSSSNYCTQCEAQGFRRISYYLDRPDNMAIFTTTITADKKQYPVLLSNGNQVDAGDDGDMHWVKWHDPFPKPSYLFALVAGNLVKISDSFNTISDRNIALEIFVEPVNKDKCSFAMESLKKAMRWDEEVYGREYDLDIYMIVAVDDFNMGAMENKGLNVFNSKYVLAKSDTATDSDYEGIEGVIAHEYFHNWTGNRITCRDWFQLSLKEGLTVFRDQEFSADMQSRSVKRIQDVRILRTAQFAQDAGPMAHPIRPDSYMEISNFYTVTVYNKGAEVIRMIHQLLGAEGFRRGTDLYFQRHDNQAVTTEDFVAAMSDANDADLEQFKNWYSQAGTPALHVSSNYDAAEKRYDLTISQSCPATPEQEIKQPFHIPVVVGLLGVDGKDVPLHLSADYAQPEREAVLNIKNETQTFSFYQIDAEPVPSILRGFSAPVKVHYDYSDSDLIFLMANDSDEFNRWDASQTYVVKVIERLIEDYNQDKSLVLDEAYSAAFAKTLSDKNLDKALIAEALSLPSENYLSEMLDVVDVDAIHHVREFLKQALAIAHQSEFLQGYQENQVGDYCVTAEDIAVRQFKNLCLGYLMELPEEKFVDMAQTQFSNNNNMTDQISALHLLVNRDCPERDAALQQFYDQWHHEPLVLDKWFSLQASSRLPSTPDNVRNLLQHADFNIKNPNRVRSLVGVFAAANPYYFHAKNGDGYEFLAEQVIKLDTLNPQIAARLVSVFTRWKKYDQHRQNLILEKLRQIKETNGLSKDVYEIVSKSLAAA
jgi:aminopeptidase N